ncbi:hypothetical protein, partial [Streptomyces griseoaurantiacus]|uniref:hypothetical protein n=1 Tax=Streptomyces griseoaurantiacus TaxID=68213 RepID=UPI001782B2F2
MTREEVWNKIQIGRLGITEDLRIFEKRRQTPAEALERPDDLSVEYLNQVIQHRRANERRGVEDYESPKLPPFEAGCPDNELPSHMRRRMPRDAVADTLDRVNPDDVHLIYPGDGGGMWRDLSEGDAFLRPENAIFRLDSRGAELLQAGGFRVRDPGNLNINAHVGSAHNGGGFTSFSMSPEHAIQRDEAV